MQQEKFYLIVLFSIIFFPLQAVIPLDTTSGEDGSHETNEILGEAKRIEGDPFVDPTTLLIAQVGMVNPPAYVIINSSQDMEKLAVKLVNGIIAQDQVRFFSLDAAFKYKITNDIGKGSHIRKIFP